LRREPAERHSSLHKSIRLDKQRNIENSLITKGILLYERLPRHQDS